MILIDKEPIKKFIEDGLNNPDKQKAFGYDAVRIFAEIEYAPVIDAEPVVRAQWKYYHKQNIAVCTNCSFERDLDANFGKAISCPSCGAKMEGRK